MTLEGKVHAFNIIQITANSTDDELPAIFGSNVVWNGHDGSNWEVHSWDGLTWMDE